MLSVRVIMINKFLELQQFIAEGATDLLRGGDWVKKIRREFSNLPFSVIFYFDLISTQDQLILTDIFDWLNADLFQSIDP